MRMKDVIISVTGVQQGVNGPDAMELVTAGQYGQDEKETLLTWQESELTGMEGTKTSLCVQPRSVVLSREGTLNTRMEFEEGRKRYFLYETPFGSATMGLNTRRIVNRLGAHGGGDRESITAWIWTIRSSAATGFSSACRSRVRAISAMSLTPIE